MCNAIDTEHKHVGEFVVRRYRIIGTKTVVHDVYEPIASAFDVTHHTITCYAGQWYGSVATRSLPSELDKLPAMTEERSNAVREYYDGLYALAHTVIVSAYPECLDGRAFMGDIETLEESNGSHD